DRFICYMTKLSRWIGVLEILEGPYRDDTPFYFEEDDPFVIRFRVRPVVWLPKEKAIPIHEAEVWNTLSFTKDHDKHTSAWTAKIRRSLNELDKNDGKYLEDLLASRERDNREYEIDEKQYQKYVTHRIRRLDRVVSVSVPEDNTEETEEDQHASVDVRESIQIQALIAELGFKMGHSIWVPRSDRARVKIALGENTTIKFLDTLPLNYDDTTLKTIEQIDVLWLKGRAIVKAFEVEHTTSVYSGILRMADLLALQPNMDIELHIVAPESRKEKVFNELLRPVFSLLDRGPLSEICTYLSYDAIHELLALPHLHHMSAQVLDDYTEQAE
ncbi:MAG: hypothetical protein K8S14_05125, partial [Actinomycetia bacterium]|nr:hypothetical protein [Actinomycetes bacterium]